MGSIPNNLLGAVGRIVVEEDTIVAAPVAGLMAAFGSDDPDVRLGDPLPPLWHGLFAPPSCHPLDWEPMGWPSDEGLLPAASDFPNKLLAVQGSTSAVRCASAKKFVRSPRLSRLILRRAEAVYL